MPSLHLDLFFRNDGRENVTGARTSSRGHRAHATPPNLPDLPTTSIRDFERPIGNALCDRRCCSLSRNGYYCRCGFFNSKPPFMFV
jgi:hypothetical protein